jgi:hypothetical protein
VVVGAIRGRTIYRREGLDQYTECRSLNHMLMAQDDGIAPTPRRYVVPHETGYQGQEPKNQTGMAQGTTSRLRGGPVEGAEKQGPSTYAKTSSPLLSPPTTSPLARCRLAALDSLWEVAISVTILKLIT